jgi:hypothetical protein
MGPKKSTPRVSIGEVVTPGAPRDPLGSPRAPPTGVSAAALRSPARTGRALSGRRAPSSVPPPPGGPETLPKLPLLYARHRDDDLHATEERGRVLFTSRIESSANQLMKPFPFIGFYAYSVVDTVDTATAHCAAGSAQRSRPPPRRSSPWRAAGGSCRSSPCVGRTGPPPCARGASGARTGLPGPAPTDSPSKSHRSLSPELRNRLDRTRKGVLERTVLAVGGGGGKGRGWLLCQKH